MSGSGKTTVTLGLLAAFTRRGLRTAPFKVGPDFIDPGHHTRVAGRPCRNLDGWMLSKSRNIQCFEAQTRDADIAVVEGVMGLFDGYDGRSEAGSTAQMAKWLDLPVLLIVDAGRMARSAAALVKGFERFDQKLRFLGVVFNRIGSERHLVYLKEALNGHVGMPCLGGIPRNEEIGIPERHLGLFTAHDHPLADTTVQKLADVVETHVDIPALLERLSERTTVSEPSRAFPLPVGETVRVGIPRDNAFCFYYPDNLEMLQKWGAELVFFSPIKAGRLPEDLDGLYLGGGYPELFAEDLVRQADLRDQIRRLGREGMPIYGECGGFMYLCKELIDTEGNLHPMSGCFPFVTRMSRRLRSLGYREITLTRKTILGEKNRVIRGHEFHYSEIAEKDPAVETVYKVSDKSVAGSSTEGYRVDRCLGSYIHLHFGSCPEAAKSFVENCLNYRRERIGYRETGRN